MIRYIPSPFAVMEIPPDRWLVTIHDLTLWEENTTEKVSILPKTHPCYDRIFACGSIARSIVRILSEKLLNPPSYLHLAISKHEQKGIQAVMLFTEFNSVISISHLVTNPKNIYMTLNEMIFYKAIKGSGTSLIRYLEDYAKKQFVNRISVGALQSSITFYQKFGFEIEKKANQSVITIMNLFLDKITSSKAA